MKKILLVSLILFSIQYVFAQLPEDAVKFSKITNLGNARSAGMAGAFGALGGDLSSATGNPAGIGVFRKSEFSFTPSLSFNNTKSGNMDGEKVIFQVGNMGLLISSYNPNFDWRGVNFGFNYTLLNNFHRTLNQGVIDSPHSLMDIYATHLNDYGYDPFSTMLAKDVYLLELDPTGMFYRRINVQENVDQQKMLKERGYQGEYSFSVGTNYKDRLYLGMTLGMQSLDYRLTSEYTEFAIPNSPSELYAFRKNEFVDIYGPGLNLKFGAIYRPIPQLRLGAAIHTPTWYRINYEYKTYIESWFNDNYSTASIVARDERDITMRTPWRAIISAAGVLGPRAIISVDYEYVDYSNARYHNPSDNQRFAGTNKDITDLYHGTHNIRVGAEYRFDQVFSLRGGYGFMDSPFKDKGYSFVNNIPGGDQHHMITGGLGMNFGNIYCDAAYIHQLSKDTTIFYVDDYDMAAPVKNKYKDNQVRLTLGFRF